MNETMNVISSATLYAKINGEYVWHTFILNEDIKDYYLWFTTSSLTKSFKIGWYGTKVEAVAAINKEIAICESSGFNTNMDNCFKGNITMNIPMKALPFGKGKTTFPCYYQPKINGGRCIGEKKIDCSTTFPMEDNVFLTSKEGHNLPIQHIKDQLKPIYDMFGSPIFDGEIYLYGEKCTSINGAARNPKNPIHDKLALVIFDIIIYGVSQFVRTAILDKIHRDTSVDLDDNWLCTSNNNEAIGKYFFLSGGIVKDEEQARTLAEICIDAGFEGIILRNPEAVYQQGKHVGNLTKIKKQLEGMFCILNIVAKPTLEDQPLFILQNDITGDSFECNPVGSHDTLTKYLINRTDYIGKMVKVTYYERTINNLPFHANVYPEVMSDYDDTIKNNEGFEDYTPTINNIDDL